MTKSINIKKASFATAAVLFLSLLLIPTLASAQGRGGNSDKKAEIEARVKERKENAETRIAEKRESAEVKSAEKRQEACERRAEKLESSMDRVASQAGRLLGVMDRFYERVQGFYDSGQLTVSNYDELNTAVEEAQNAATVEVEALSELNVDVDCSDENAVLGVSAYRASAGQSKELLKAYRKALVDLISSMKSAAAEKSGDDSSDDSTEDENESVNEVENETETENEVDTETQIDRANEVPTESIPETPESEEVN